jgi:hypothetical protein
MEEALLLLRALVVGMAAWRVSSLFVREEGPGNFFQRIREKCGIIHHENGAIIVPEKFMAEMLACVWCFSVWATPIMWGMYYISPEVVFIIAAMTIPVVIDERLHTQ